MSRSLRTKTPTFRFNRNDDDLLEEVIESQQTINELQEETNNGSNGAQENTSSSDYSLQSNQTPTKSSVKEFITSRLNKTKSLDEENSKESNITSNWFHDIKGKIKEKIEEKKREKELKQLNDEIKSNEDSVNSDLINTKTTEINDENPFEKNLHNISHDLSVDYENDIFPPIDSSLTETEELELLVYDSLSSQTNDSLSQTNVVETQKLWSYSQLYYLIAIGFAFISFLIAISSPLPSFFNGLLLGCVCTLLSLSVFIVFIVSKFFIRKSNPKKDGIKSQNFRSKRKDDEIYKGWVHEFIGNYEERDTGFKTQLIYVRLQGSNLRLSKPKQDIRKLKLDSNSLPLFISQRIFDLTKMSQKRVSLLLPKSVRNQKKYIWSKKYPICLELEDLKSKNVNKLIFFIRNCREKEEWFWKLRETIDYSLNSLLKEDKEMSVLSGPPSPKSTEDIITAEIEHLPRTQSLDLGSIQSATTYSSTSSSPTSPTKELQILSKHIDYHLFMKKILSFKSIQTSSLSSLSWFNALIGRVCFDVLNEEFWSNYVAAKIQRKLRRLRLPYFMESLTITEIDVGNTLPKFNDVPTPPVLDKRGLWIDFDITYSGGFTMTLETKLNLMKLKEVGTGSQEMRNFQNDIDISDNESDSIMTSSDEEVEEKPVDPDDADNTKKQQKILKFVDKIASSQYFQKATENKYIKRAMEGVSKTALILTVQIQTLNGTLALNIPEPPTDRLWYGFRGNPDLVLSARPKLGEHEVSIHQVTDIIERKLRAEFAKVLVMPNMDDLIIPILKTNIDQFITVVP